MKNFPSKLQNSDTHNYLELFELWNCCHNCVGSLIIFWVAYIKARKLSLFVFSSRFVNLVAQFCKCLTISLAAPGMSSALWWVASSKASVGVNQPKMGSAAPASRMDLYYIAMKLRSVRFNQFLDAFKIVDMNGFHPVWETYCHQGRCWHNLHILIHKFSGL